MNAGIERSQVANPIKYPYTCLGIVSSRFEEQYYYGTGSLITEKIVLTAAHNVYNRIKH